LPLILGFVGQPRATRCERFARLEPSFLTGVLFSQTPRNPLYYPSILLILLSARHLLPTNPWTHLTSRLRNLESRYIAYHAQLSSDAESIAFHNSGSILGREKLELSDRAAEWTDFQDRVEKIRSEEDRWEGWVVNDLWSGAGMLVSGWNVFASPFPTPDQSCDYPSHDHGHEHSHSHSHSHSDEAEHDRSLNLAPPDVMELASHRAGVFLESRALVAGASDAMGRLLHAGRELRELEGTGGRVGALAEALEHDSAESSVETNGHSNPEMEMMENVWEEATGEQEAIEFEGVDVFAPLAAGEEGREEVLVRGLTLRWERGMNIVGLARLFSRRQTNFCLFSS